MMLTKEECLEALRDIEFNLPISYINSEYGLFGRCAYVGQIEILKNLIYEHFNNPPLKFEELKENMWVWDNYWEEYFEISEVYSNTKEIDVLIHQNKINQKRYETIKYTPNRFYRKEVQE